MPTKTAVCARCTAPFSYARPEGQVGRLRLYCGPECAKAATSRSPATRTCSTCGKDFHPRHGAGGKRQAFCSLMCRRYPERRIYETASDRARAKEHRRKARKRDGPIQTINASEIFRRDGYCCGICGKKTDPAPRAKRDARPTLDHIVPLALGGRHVRSNVQCAHWICNASKSHRFGGQLKLDFLCVVLTGSDACLAEG